MPRTTAKIAMAISTLLLLISSVCAQVSVMDYVDLSLDSLLNIQISTAAKHEQSTSEAPAKHQPR